MGVVSSGYIAINYGGRGMCCCEGYVIGGGRERWNIMSFHVDFDGWDICVWCVVCGC